jgi:hypothetical protein
MIQKPPLTPAQVVGIILLLGSVVLFNHQGIVEWLFGPLSDFTVLVVGLGLFGGGLWIARFGFKKRA